LEKIRTHSSLVNYKVVKPVTSKYPPPYLPRTPPIRFSNTLDFLLGQLKLKISPKKFWDFFDTGKESKMLFLKDSFFSKPYLDFPPHLSFHFDFEYQLCFFRISPSRSFHLFYLYRSLFGRLLSKANLSECVWVVEDQGIERM